MRACRFAHLAPIHVRRCASVSRARRVSEATGLLVHWSPPGPPQSSHPRRADVPGHVDRSEPIEGYEHAHA